MKIDIVGGGALGLLHAAKLAQAGIEITVWTRTESQASILRTEGIRLLDHEEHRVKVNSECLSILEAKQMPELAAHWIILTVKQSHITEELMQLLGKLGGQGASLLCLQNGIGHLEKLAHALPQYELLAGVTTEGAKRLDANTVQHTGIGQLWFGQMDEKESKKDENAENPQKLLLNALQLAGFNTFLSNEMNDRIYQKLLSNAVINPLTALFDVTNGELPKHPMRERLMKALYEETSAILIAAGMNPNPNGWKIIVELCEATANNVSSMLSDVRAGRPTEIQWINEGISSIARRRAIPSPLNDAVSVMVSQLTIN
ncbi:MAG: ketopantoate reductase family protein [Candidatus Pristimantibacillus sp.]